MIPQRFVDKVRVIPCGGCWEWTARRNRDGYGEFWWDDRAQKAHRVAYERLTVGDQAITREQYMEIVES